MYIPAFATPSVSCLMGVYLLIFLCSELEYQHQEEERWMSWRHGLGVGDRGALHAQQSRGCRGRSGRGHGQVAYQQYASRRRQSSDSSRRSLSAGRCCPKLFERASGSWWDPKFNSTLIETHFQKQSFPQLKRRFRYAVSYTLLVCITWLIYLPIRVTIMDKQCNWVGIEIALACMILVCIGLIIFTTRSLYRDYVIPTSLVLIVHRVRTHVSVVCVFH